MMQDSPSDKLTFEQVYEYAKKSVSHYIRKFCYQLPFEQKEEISQNALLRVWVTFEKLDPTQGWKSFIQLHCRGAVLDYLKGGDRDIEAELGLSRLEILSDSGNNSVLDPDEIAGIFGIHANHRELNHHELNPNWALLKRMCSKDEDLHIVAKVLLGFSQEEIAAQFETALGGSISRERVSQRIYEFFDKLDSPDFLDNLWINQCIFALGLSKYYHMAEADNGLGWDLQSFDLNDVESFKKVRAHFNPTFFDLCPQDVH